MEFIYDKTYYNCQIEGEWCAEDEERIKVLGLEALEAHMVRILAGEVEARKYVLRNLNCKKYVKS